MELNILGQMMHTKLISEDDKNQWKKKNKISMRIVANLSNLKWMKMTA